VRHTQHQVGTAHVDLADAAGVAAVEGIGRAGVHHRLATPDGLFDRSRVGDVPHDRVEVWRLEPERRQGGGDPVAGAHQQAHLMAALDQGGDGIGSDVAGPTGDQNAYPAPLW
jgi:hypothetical protein